ncbi:MAG: hypothetical protein AAF228_06720 [Pseudomonadota bacterium]
MTMYKRAVTLYISVLIFLSFAHFAEVAAACLPWHEARSVIKKNGLLDASKVRRKSKRYGGKIIKLRLCEADDRYVYQVGMLVPGKVKRVILDARTGKRLTRSGSVSGAALPSKQFLRKVSPRFRRFIPRQFRKRYFRRRFRR